MKDLLDETKWKTALNFKTFKRDEFDEVSYLSSAYAEYHNCTDDDGYLMFQYYGHKGKPWISQNCFRKCCPAISSLSYRFDKTIIDWYMCDQDSKFSLQGKRMKMTTFEEVPKMSRVDLFGLVGGYFGLFVGISLVTFFEFIELGLTWCFGGRSKKTKQTEDLSCEDTE